ncbi:hypothetical protein ACIPJK_31535 [Streptomyces roseus]|uniref:hypothetical protein n=1 Tax=Streptomyces roseus TaxID=66430 RepID=UPI0038200B28
MEDHPRRVLAGLALTCFACGADRGRILVRSEYPAAFSALRRAYEEACAEGHFGRNAHGTGRALEVEVCAGHGSYVAGEETALIATLEGGRGCAVRGRRIRPNGVCGMPPRWSATWRRWPRCPGSRAGAAPRTPDAGPPPSREPSS